MEADRGLIDAAMRSFIGSYRTLAQHVEGGSARDFGAVFAVTTGVPFGIFNCVIVDEPPDDRDLDAALDWIAGERLPYLFCIPEALLPTLAPVADRRAMRRSAWLPPHMALAEPPAPPPPPPGIAIQPVTDAATAASFREGLAASGIPLAMAERLMPDSFLDDDDVRGFVAYLDGAVVGTSIAIRTGDVTGVYAVGTAESARRRGVGTATTWAAVEAGRLWSSPVVVLQSSEMGVRVYEAMGFRTVGRFAEFAPPR